MALPGDPLSMTPNLQYLKKHQPQLCWGICLMCNPERLGCCAEETGVIRELALCSGIGGISLGLKLALGVDHRTVCHVERDGYAAAVLVARMEDKALDQAPVWDCIESFDGKPWRGMVDIVTAGYPCQPHSVAGKRLGADDDRNLWPEVARAIGEVQPHFAFLENVPGAMRFTYDEVIPDLRHMGYEVAAGLFSAEECGADHQRARLFVFGALASGRGLLRCRNGQGGPWAREQLKGLLHKEVELSVSAGARGRISDGASHRVDRLRAAANAVVPVVAAKAFVYLADELTATRRQKGNPMTYLEYLERNGLVEQ